MKIAQDISAQIESQSLNALVAGFSFAAALAWMDLVRLLVAMIVKTPKNGPMALTITALMTTLLSVLVFMLVARFSKRVVKPVAPTYAVTSSR